MKKVSFMKLNIQQENVLSKEEKKQILGGAGPSRCYVTCYKSNSSGTTWNDFGADDCYSADSLCQSKGFQYHTECRCNW